MEVERRQHESYEWKIQTLLGCCGLWIETNLTVKLTLAYFVFSCNFLMGLAVLNFCVQHASNIIILTKGMSLAISMFTACVKIVIFLRYQGDMEYLHKNLTAKYFEDMKDAKNRPHLLSRIALYVKFFWICCGTVFSVAVLYIIIPIIAFVKHGKYMRMFPTIYPLVGKPTGLAHWCCFVLEVLTSLFLSSVTAGVDCCFGMYSFQMCGELRVLASKFQSLAAAPDYKERVKDCIVRHQMLYNTKKKLENLFGIITIWFAITASISLCAIIFQLSQSKNVSLFQIFFTVDYITAKLLQAYTFAWFGNTITVESEKCVQSIYHCDWPGSGDSRLMKDMLIVQLQSPMYINAMGVMIVRLDMFIKIAHASISYFFLLKTIEEKLA
ncbi:uncharacterized protein LOC131663995 [Phymastichus coffea]|uniref:uncharacterized protein LOC131663995 n=1 Tax=Phymastichus coffea TaxID=108790 RepID=UPI00273C07F4|nr:uncharacterized protein LOC131663995 [Phymastichus coffea]